MKNLNKLFVVTILLSILTLVSCGGANLKAIDEKIEKEGMEANFSSDEYDAMIGFIEKLFKDNPQYDSTDDKQIAQFAEDFGKMFNYIMVLGFAKDNGNLSSSQIAKLDKIQQNAAKQANNGFGGMFEDDINDNEEYEGFDLSEGTQKVIVDLNGNIIGDYVGETSTNYRGVAQDEFEVSKSNHKVIELNNENGEGVVFCKNPGDVVKVYKEPSLDAPVIGNMIYEEGYLPQTYECVDKKGNWYKIRFNHKTGYVDANSVEWSAEDYF